MTAYSCPQESPLESGSREKKRPSVPAAFIQINPTSRFNPTTDPKSFTMLPLKRLTTAIVVTLLIGFALALSKESSSSSAFSRGWIRGRQDAHGDTARSVLAKRDDAPLTNTTAASVASTQVSSQQPTSGTPAASASSARELHVSEDLLPVLIQVPSSNRKQIEHISGFPFTSRFFKFTQRIQCCIDTCYESKPELSASCVVSFLSLDDLGLGYIDDCLCPFGVFFPWYVHCAR